MISCHFSFHFNNVSSYFKFLVITITSSHLVSLHFSHVILLQLSVLLSTSFYPYALSFMSSHLYHLSSPALLVHSHHYHPFLSNSPPYQLFSSLPNSHHLNHTCPFLTFTSFSNLTTLTSSHRDPARHNKGQTSTIMTQGTVIKLVLISC